MHRCGTSVVAKTLFELGLDLGVSEQFLPANESNPLGYFENQWLSYQVNDVLLEHFSGSWKSPPDFPHDWLEIESVKRLEEDVRQFARANFSGSHWGWKDPRSSLLLPFWKRVFPQTRHIICLRNPLDVAASLQVREDMPISAAIKLWKHYVTSALFETEDSERLVLFFEDVITNSHTTIRRLANFCDLGIPPSMLEAESGVFPELNHHGQSLDRENDAGSEFIEELSYYHGLRQRFTDEQVNLDAEPAPKLRLPNESLGPSKALDPPKVDQPIVSIVIPTFNRLDMLKSCLRAILQFTEPIYQIVVVDDGSSDGTAEFLAALPHVVVVSNQTNLDFLLSANKGANETESEFIVFLNNDVVVREGWLSKLLAVISDNPECGAVGPKFVNFDGSLQEAGCYVTEDANVVIYGSAGGAFCPEFGYLREVDYCSGACLLVRSSLFFAAGGFDTRFVPAYFEDVDLCFQINQAGYKVFYQPEAVVFHHGTGSRSLEKARELCEVNRSKFSSKWRTTLELRSNEAKPVEARDKRAGDRVLVFTESIPRISSTAVTSKLLLDLLDEEKVVTLAPTMQRFPLQPQLAELQQLGVEVMYGAYFDPLDFIYQRSDFYHSVYFETGCDKIGLLEAVHETSANSLTVVF